MLKTRVITAILLLAVLLPILYSGSLLAFSFVVVAFFGAAIWETQRLFQKPAPVIIAVVWVAFFIYFIVLGSSAPKTLLFAVSILFWLVKLIPSLRFGLPNINGLANGILSGLYAASIFACFAAIYTLFGHSPIYLFSALAIVWVADIGAYFAGKAFGRNKLAPTISPGKSWEGAIGGWFAVVLISTIVCFFPALHDTVQYQLQARWGWIAFIFVLTILSAASVCGDLFESMLKRRIAVKDSSNLLPGHGGVLDRIDALIPVLPIIALLDVWGHS